MNKKLLAMLLVLSMLLTVLPATLAEDAPDAPADAIEAPVGEAVGETGAEGLVAIAESNDAPTDDGDDPAIETIIEDPAEEIESETDAADASAEQTGIQPDTVRFNVKTLNIGLNETSTALQVILGSDPDVDYIRELTFTSSKTKYVKVDQNGVLKGVKKGGTSTITVTTANGKKATCKVTVKKAPSKVTVSAKSAKLSVGQTLKLTAKLNSSSAAGAIHWISSDESVAAVDTGTGLVTAVAPGKATVSAVTYNNKHADAEITVLAEPTLLYFDDETPTIGVGQKLTLAAHLNPGAECAIAYESLTPNIATVSGSTLTAVAEGTATIEASIYNGLFATCEVNVAAAPKSVKLPFSTLYLGVGQTFQLEPIVDGYDLKPTYTPSKKTFFSVSGGGLVKGVKAGTAYITIKTYNNKSFKLKVIVQKAPGSVTISPKTIELSVGESSNVRYTVPKGCYGSATLESSDPEIAAVDSETGEVVGLKPGVATITATTFNGKHDSCVVSVYGKPTAMWMLNDGNIELAAKDTEKLEVGFPKDEYCKVNFVSDDPKIATVSAEGVITGKAGGTTTVRALTFYPDIHAEVTVTVWDAPDSVDLVEKNIELTLGGTYQLNPIIPDNTRTTFTYKSSNTSAIPVDALGLIHGLKRGSATITVSTHNGKTVKATVRVTDPDYPESVTILGKIPKLTIGEGCTIAYEVYPDTAKPELTWKSSNTRVATVSQKGVVTAVGRGQTTITAVSSKNEDCALSVVATVYGSGYMEPVTEIPARITDISGIEDNLDMIEAIRECALSEIDRMEDEGEISHSDAVKRASIVNNIFDCYAFPWMTLNYQNYWKAANSEDGVKDFKPGKVYYGLPYISGTGNNRRYNTAWALKENRYYDSGKGYYILNQNKLLNGKYVGNDCSGLVDTAIWGTTHAVHSDDRTDEIASSSAYRTISSFKAMRTGDLVCWGGHHVIMFLYYVNDEKTRFMMIENGGAEAGTNTVHCDIYPTSYYSSRGYKVRRLASLG